MLMQMTHVTNTDPIFGTGGTQCTAVQTVFLVLVESTERLPQWPSGLLMGRLGAVGSVADVRSRAFDSDPHMDGRKRATTLL